ncbi:MAG: hypothetical protein H7123_06410, partial [Thermoleophilia bacterium]|nr:hypothetical protein [Thermoleophilia bacterium]
MINTLILFRRSRVLFWLVSVLFLIVTPIVISIALIATNFAKPRDIIQMMSVFALGGFMGPVIVATLVTVDAKQGMVRYFAMTGESRLRHFLVRIVSATLIWVAITTAVSLALLALALLADGSQAGLFSFYLHQLSTYLLIISVACLTIGSLALL